ncbi:hypothetical protein KC19_6G082400 [Ceratodon purpureus]|uniref:Secreted protein n=1 Tax=Ceratodon purpureus TaxID=3225 RepID=A0A8T0HC08_CERPU|nr:hypothetical protein KC19_6G082400 [Ceratodon purpureus]
MDCTSLLVLIMKCRVVCMMRNLCVVKLQHLCSLNASRSTKTYFPATYNHARCHHRSKKTFIIILSRVEAV